MKNRVKTNSPLRKTRYKVISIGAAAVLTVGLGIGSYFHHNNPVNEEDTLSTENDLIITEVEGSVIEPDIHTIAPEDSVNTENIGLESEDEIESPDAEITELETEISVESSTSPSTEQTVAEEDTLEEPIDTEITETEEETEETSEEETTTEAEEETTQPAETDVKLTFKETLTVLNSTINMYLNDKGVNVRPTITGIESITGKQDKSSYTFILKLEGSTDGESIAPYYVRYSEGTKIGEDFYKLLTSKNVEIVDCLTGITGVAENGEITGFSSLKILQAENQNSAVTTIINDYVATSHLTAQQIMSASQRLTESKIASAKVKIYPNASPAGTPGNYKYTTDITVKFNDVTYHSILTISSENILNSNALTTCIQNILNGKSVDVDFSFDTVEIPNYKIESAVGKIEIFNSKSLAQ